MFAISTKIKDKLLYLKHNNTDLRFTDKIDESYKFDSKQVKRLLKKLKIDRPHLEFKKYRIPEKYYVEIIKSGNFILRNKVPYSSVESLHDKNISSDILMSNTDTFKNLKMNSIKDNYHTLSIKFYRSFEPEKFKSLNDWKVSIIYVDTFKKINTINLYTLKNKPVLKNGFVNNLYYYLDFQINEVNLSDLNKLLKNKFKTRLVKIKQYYSSNSKYVISERDLLKKTHNILQRKNEIFFSQHNVFHEEPMFLKFMFFELAYLVTHLLKEGLKFEIKFEEV